MSVIRGDKNAKYLPPQAMSGMGGPPAMGLIDAIFASFEATTMTMNPFGMEQAFQEADDENVRKAIEAGFDVKPLDYIGEGLMGPTYGRGISREAGYAPYTDFQRAASDAETFATRDDDEDKRRAGMRQIAADKTRERDEILRKAAEARPDLGIETTDKIRQRIIKTGIDKQTRWSQSRPGIGANIGGFLGEMAANMDYTTNPLWLTNFVGGGAGKTLATRLLSQFGFNAAAEFTQQITGGKETMRWFGIEPTYGQLALQAGVAGVGAAGLQGIGEFLGRRAFRPRPKPAAPPPAPMATPPAMPARSPGTPIPMATAPAAVMSRMRTENPAREIMDAMGVPPVQRLAFAYDVDHMGRQASYWGTSPGDTRPPTERLKDGARVVPNPKQWLGPGADDIGVVFPPSWQRAAKDTAAIDAESIARGEWGAGRAVDPDTFKQIDKVREQMATTREQLRVALALTGERIATNKFSGPGREMWAWVASRTQGTPETDRLLADALAAGERVRGESGVARVAKEMQAIRNMQDGGKLPLRFDPIKLTKKLAELTQRMGELLPLADRATARAQGEWGTALRSEVDVEWARIIADGPPGMTRKPPRWLTDSRSVKKLVESEPEIPELAHPAALMGGKVNEPKIDRAQRAADAIAKERAELNDSTVAILAKVKDEADELRKNPDSKPPGESKPDALDEFRERLDNIGDKTLMMDDKEITYKEFIDNMKHEADAVGDIAACRVTMGWASGGNG
jgi:hypothetical protein